MAIEKKGSSSSSRLSSLLDSIPEESKEELSASVASLYVTYPPNFSPKLYSFRFPLKVCPRETYTVLAPPFWVLVDHLLGVVWHLYASENQEKLGIIHLQWALEFARWIRDDKGEYSKTIRELINIVEEALIDRYASLTAASEKQAEEETRSKKKEEEEETAEPPEIEDGGRRSSSVRFNLATSTPKNTSVTLRDVMARDTGLNQEKANELYGKRSCLSTLNICSMGDDAKADGATKDTAILKLLQYLKLAQLERVNKEVKILMELENAASVFEAGEMTLDQIVAKFELERKC